MTTPLRRRAERFAQLLDEANGGRRQRIRTPHDDELATLVELPERLRTDAQAPELDPEFRTGLRAMLVATAEREGIGVTASTPPPPARKLALPRGPRARTAIAAGLAAGTVALTGMATASDDAVPGDPLYGVKRSTERAQLALASSDVGRGQLYLDFARTRLHEAGLLASDLDRVLGDMDRDTSHGVRLLTTAAANRHDRAALDVIDGFVGDQRAALEKLLDQVVDGDVARVTRSLALLQAIGDRAGELRASLDHSCPAITSVDALGPVPGDCVALPTPGLLGTQRRPADGHQSPHPPQQAAMQAAAGTSNSGCEPVGHESPVGAAHEGHHPVIRPAGADPAPESSTGESGLLNGINRLLGNLLGN